MPNAVTQVPTIWDDGQGGGGGTVGMGWVLLHTLDGVGETTADFTGSASGTFTASDGVVYDYTTTGVTATTWGMVEDEGFVWDMSAATNADVFLRLKRVVEAAGGTWDPLGHYFVVLHWSSVTYPAGIANMTAGRFEIDQGTITGRVEGHTYYSGGNTLRRMVVQDLDQLDVGTPDAMADTDFYVSLEIAGPSCTIRFHASTEPTKPDPLAPIWDANYPAYTSPRIDVSTGTLTDTMGVRIGADGVAAAMAQKCTVKVYRYQGVLA